MGEKGNGLAADDTGTGAEGVRAVATKGISGSVAEDPGTGAQGEASVVNSSRSNIKNNMEEPVGGGTGTTGTNPDTPDPGSNKPPTPEAGTYSTTKSNIKGASTEQAPGGGTGTKRSNIKNNLTEDTPGGGTGTTGSTPQDVAAAPGAEDGIGGPGVPLGQNKNKPK